MKFYIFFIVSIMLFADEITSYKVVQKCSGKLMAFREFNEDGKNKSLVVDLQTLQTKVISKTFHESCDMQNSRYGNLVLKSIENSSVLHNAGITNSSTNSNAIFLTIDMCPSSKKGYEKRLFDVIDFPIGVAITKKWIDFHQNEFSQLLDKKLDITWINHTATHFYDSNLPDNKNFMLSLKDKEIENEIIENEKTLLAHHQIPSIFFRFPGLISNQKVVDQIITKYSLIPLGSNAWIAKVETIKDGSIILLHGNLNEKLGVDKFLQLLDSKEIPYDFASLDKI